MIRQIRQLIGPKFLAAGLACLLAASSAQAALVFVTDAVSYPVAPGAPAAVKLYLMQTEGEITAGGGLNGTAAQLQVISPVPTTPMTLLSIAPAAPFNFNATDVGNGQINVALSDLNAGVAVDGQDRVLLGTFSIGLDNGGAGQETSFRFVPLSTDNTYLADGTGPLDGSLGASEAFTVSVPEPATLSLLAIGGLTLLRRRRIA